MRKGEVKNGEVGVTPRIKEEKKKKKGLVQANEGNNKKKLIKRDGGNIVGLRNDQRGMRTNRQAHQVPDPE